MRERLDWDNLRLFLAIARAGGLAGATEPSGVSAPTLGRRMYALEQGLGLTLFHRRRDGYDLTAAGRELLARAEALEEGALAIERWRAAAEPEPTVRIAAGAWTSEFLARNAGELRDGIDGPGFEILTGVDLADLNRREANLGIRNRPPDALGLAGRRIGPVAFAIYGTTGYLYEHPAAYDDRRYEDCDWVVFAPAGTGVPSALWLEQRLRRRPVLRCAAPQPVRDAAVAGVGLCVLPCFVGDAEPGLVRAAEPIPNLRHDQWLVSHDDDRHNPAIRGMADRLIDLFRRHRELFAGGRGVPG